MPGPVAKAHENLEATCTNCHSRFDRTDQSRLCLDCHEEVASDIQLDQGFHGRNPDVAGTTCATCHTDHEGRNADIVGLKSTRFNHNFTDFKLEGGHLDAQCTDCHLPAVNFRDAPTECNSCHKDDDPHEGELGPSCETCHSVDDWQEVVFDHSSTAFELRGKHAQTLCLECHADQTFQNAPDDCYSCHKEDDPHEESLGQDCQTCHTESDWQSAQFDHNSTNFSLVGKHETAQCLDCHADQTFQQTSADCNSCHMDDDVHDGRNGTDCQKCHTEFNWDESLFNHARDTQFKLDGQHKQLSCIDCHTTDPFVDRLDMTCVSCHVDDDVHKGNNGPECESCHVAQSWETTNFDHDFETNFNIRGKHQELACGDCHTENVFEVELETTCISCHREDDPHKGKQGESCSDCHNESDWTEVADFDHDFSRFPLLGKHTTLECSDCHTTSVFQEASTQCIDCHQDDDYHEGKFGNGCQSCHNPVAWDIWFFDHDVQTDFILDGAHNELTCESCHSESDQDTMALSQTCDSCHQQDDIHDGEFGGQCDRCHTTDSFLDLSEIE